jgi:hypothetical protein
VATGRRNQCLFSHLTLQRSGHARGLDPGRGQQARDQYADPASNVVDVRIRLLRGKPGPPPLIHTVRAAGYVADTEPR